jgi:hypothetical protein
MLCATPGVGSAEFLAREEVACQIDNYYVRAMLWPHPKVLDGDFSARRHDRTPGSPSCRTSQALRLRRRDGKTLVS